MSGKHRSDAGQPASSRTAIPPGTRDVLPEEMRELRAISSCMRDVFEEAGYGEIHTPALEYEEVLRRGEERAAGARYRTFDEQGDVLALRSDMTIPIARVVATRYRGLELIGVPGAEGDAEVVALTLAALDEVGLRRHRLGVGDGSLYRRLLGSLGVPTGAHRALLECLSRRDLVGLERGVAELGLGEPEHELLVRLPELRGGRDMLEQADGRAGGAVGGLLALHELLEERGVVDRVIFDLGLVRELGYYTGAVFEVYDPAVGFALGGGGRYDDLLGRFGRGLPACGVALDLQRVHLAQAAEEALA